MNPKTTFDRIQFHLKSGLLIVAFVDLASYYSGICEEELPEALS
jgi:hypothetical protein